MAASASFYFWNYVLHTAEGESSSVGGWVGRGVGQSGRSDGGLVGQSVGPSVRWSVGVGSAVYMTLL